MSFKSKSFFAAWFFSMRFPQSRFIPVTTVVSIADSCQRLLLRYQHSKATAVLTQRVEPETAKGP